MIRILKISLVLLLCNWLPTSSFFIALLFCIFISSIFFNHKKPEKVLEFDYPRYQGLNQFKRRTEKKEEWIYEYYRLKRARKLKELRKEKFKLKKLQKESGQSVELVGKNIDKALEKEQKSIKKVSLK